jgi:hypothetical protein
MRCGNLSLFIDTFLSIGLVCRVFAHRPVCIYPEIKRERR